MAKVLIGAFALVAVALFYPSTSQAGSKYKATLVAESLDPTQVTPTGAPPIDCSSITDCTAIPPDPAQGAHNPAIVFMTSADATIHVDAGIWSAFDCPDVPDLGTATGDLDRPAGLSRIRIVFDPPLDDGTTLSIEWQIGTAAGGLCPITACQNYVLGTPPPDLCPI